jgi:hypothetical protein
VQIFKQPLNLALPKLGLGVLYTEIITANLISS